MNKSLTFLGLLASVILLIALILTLGTILTDSAPNNTTGEVLVPPKNEPVAALQKATAVEKATAVTEEQASPSPTAFSEFNQPTVTASPPNSPTREPQRPPACRFDVDAAPAQASTRLDSYVFSEPEVVLTNTRSIYIAEWLPDGERLLFARKIPNLARQNVETYNLRTNTTEIYVETSANNGKAFWMSEQEAVAYTTLVGTHYELRINSKKKREDHLIASGIPPLTLSVGPNTSTVLYFATGETTPRLSNLTTRSTELLSLNLADWQYSKAPASSPTRRYLFQIAWRPASSQVAFYSGEWLFLVDITKNELCSIELESIDFAPRAVSHALWSPNGRYLAMLTHSSKRPGEINELLILDAVTGKQFHLQPKLPYLFDISWSKDNQSLVFLGQVNQNKAEILIGMFLVTIPNLEWKRILPDKHFGPALGYHSLAWSPDGSYIATKCGTLVVKENQASYSNNRLCLIKSEQKP